MRFGKACDWLWQIWNTIPNLPWCLRRQGNGIQQACNRSTLFVSYYRGRDKKTNKESGIQSESEIDLIIEENGVLYPIEIKASSHVTSSETSAFMVLDKIPDKQRGMGAVVCMCPEPGMLRENVLQIPVWYV